jgi:putative oxidoreductase
MSTMPFNEGHASPARTHPHLTEREYVSPILPVLGRVLLSLIFIVSGFTKVMGFNAAVEYARSHHMPMPIAAISWAILIELIGGAMILLGFRTRLAAGILAIFLVPATLMFHNFWSYSGAEFQMQMIHFMKNLAIMGGLVSLAACGCQPWSVDRALVQPPRAD